MGCYYTLRYNYYAFSLLFYKVYIKRENASIRNSGPERSKSEPILHNSKCPETLRRIVLGYIKNIGRRNNRRGPTRWPQAWGRTLPPMACLPSLWAPWPAPGVHLLLYEGFWPRKIIRRLSGRSAAVSRRNLGRSNLWLRWSDSAGETSLREVEIEALVITNDPLIEGGSIFINIFTNTISSQTLVHLLYPSLGLVPVGC